MNGDIMLMICFVRSTIDRNDREAVCRALIYVDKVNGGGGTSEKGLASGDAHTWLSNGLVSNAAAGFKSFS